MVGYPHDIKGRGIFAYVVVKPAHKDRKPAADLITGLKEAVRKAIGPTATPDRIVLVSGLPKTRSGKVMRRILRKVAAGELDSLGDTTTLAEPAIVEEIIASTKQ